MELYLSTDRMNNDCLLQGDSTIVSNDTDRYLDTLDAWWTTQTSWWRAEGTDEATIELTADETRKDGAREFKAKDVVEQDVSSYWLTLQN